MKLNLSNYYYLKCYDTVKPQYNEVILATKKLIRLEFLFGRCEQVSPLKICIHSEAVPGDDILFITT